jgi:uncharacterized membrane protein (DUF373 family)
MRPFREIKADYDFTAADEERLASMSDLMAAEIEQVMEALHTWMMENGQTAAFFSDEARKAKVFSSHRAWFLALFTGHYDMTYYDRLLKVGRLHVKVGVDAHYVNRAVNIVRNASVEIISRNIQDAEDRGRQLVSLEKIMDINLDIITSSYIEAELKAVSTAYRVKDALVGFSERFTQTMNFVLVLALMGLTLGVVGLFVYDIQNLLHGNLGHGIITALGSLLILWVMIELMNTEIKHLKGGKFRISVFVGVALVAIIRDAMITTIKHEEVAKLAYFGALILILGVVFWLVTKSEERSD